MTPEITAELMKAKVANVKILGSRSHSKASEEYVDVEFTYPEQGNAKWTGSVPIAYRRTGLFIKNIDEALGVIKAAYNAMNPSKRETWLKEQEAFWNNSRKDVTRGFFEGLKDSKWKCVNCQLPKNPNWARRVQDIKEFGYTLATDTKKWCENCKKNTTHLLLLRLPRAVESGYETWSPKLRNRILKVLKSQDVYEGRRGGTALLPDHKFPEIRWGTDTLSENPDDMSDEDIKQKFQLLSNQRNQQKREVCRNCFQTGKRGCPFGIRFFYDSNENWPESIPKVGKAAEKGCIGCGWYDVEEWRKRLEEFLRKKKSES